MEERRRVSMDFKKRPRKLDFNAPLLSARHPGGYSGVEEACCSNNSQAKLQEDATSDRIPFCWEQAPGKPKRRSTDNMYVDSEADTPRLKIPPSRWHRPEEEALVIDDDHSLDVDHDMDDGCCDADVDNDDEDVFSDAVEVLSLTEAMDIVEKRAEKDHHGLDGFNLDTLGTNESISPSYIIERFLPDATALAASSVLSVSKNLSRKLPYVCNHHQHHPDAYNVPGGLQRSYSLTKGGCGLEMLFPWRIKHKICGVKSPVRPQCSDKNNKGCSIIRHFEDVKKHT